MVIKDLKKEIAEKIGGRDAQLLITSVLDISITDYMLCSDKKISDEKTTEILTKAERIKRGEPLQYVVGMAEFMSLKFRVNPAVLIPRADTETLVELAIREIGDNRCTVLDIGSGSGCVAISIANYCKNSKVTSIDISETALSVASENSRLNNTDVNFIKCDIMNSKPYGSFDMSVSNPPYIPTEVINTLDKNVREYEPKTALDGGFDGLDFYRRIISLAPTLLNKDGKLLFEVGHDQSDNVSNLLKSKFTDISITKDLCGVNRVVFGILKN